MAASPRMSSDKSPEAEARRSDIQALWKHMQDNPFAYLGSAAFLVAKLGGSETTMSHRSPRWIAAVKNAKTSSA